MSRGAQVEYHEADLNKDGVVSAREFTLWWRRRMHTLRADAAEPLSAGHAPPDGAPSAAALAKLGLLSAVPCVAFGFLDNAIMIVAGDKIDAAIGRVPGLTLSTMGCAALGNTLSDVVGQLSAGVIDAAAGRLGLPEPKLSPVQLRTSAARLSVIGGGTLGIVAGCLLGMVPLLFVSPEAPEPKRE